MPSVTWITDHWPKSIAYFKWLASKGWDEAETIKTAAGDKGSKVHLAVNDLLKGNEVKIDSAYLNKSTGLAEELTLEEYECIMSFATWHEENKPTVIASEFCVWGDGYAGTVDLLCSINGVKYLIDFKTSQYIWPSHELQVSAYKHAGGYTDTKLGILQLGYRLNKKHFKFTTVEDQYDLFLAAKAIWKKETDGVSVKQKDYPLSLKLNQNKEKS